MYTRFHKQFGLTFANNQREIDRENRANLQSRLEVRFTEIEYHHPRRSPKLPVELDL